MENGDRRNSITISWAAKGWFYLATVLVALFYAGCGLFSIYGFLYEPAKEFFIYCFLVAAALNGLCAVTLTFRRKSRGPYLSLVSAVIISAAAFLPGVRSGEIPLVIVFAWLPTALLLSLLGIMKRMRQLPRVKAPHGYEGRLAKRKKWKRAALAAGAAALLIGSGLIVANIGKTPKRAVFSSGSPHAGAPFPSIPQMEKQPLAPGETYYSGVGRFDRCESVNLGFILSADKSELREITVGPINLSVTTQSGNSTTRHNIGSMKTTFYRTAEVRNGSANVDLGEHGNPKLDLLEGNRARVELTYKVSLDSGSTGTAGAAGGFSPGIGSSPKVTVPLGTTEIVLAGGFERP